MQRPVASLMQRQPEATAGGPNPSAGGPGEEAGKITWGRFGTQGDNSQMKAALCGRGLMDSRAPRAIGSLEIAKFRSHKGLRRISGTQSDNSPI